MLFNNLLKCAILPAFFKHLLISSLIQNLVSFLALVQLLFTYAYAHLYFDSSSRMLQYKSKLRQPALTLIVVSSVGFLPACRLFFNLKIWFSSYFAVSFISVILFPV